ncbi:hypothetical protein Q7330_04980 [Glaesserella parasuis]|nr:hypothetical protein [Glaesserella parasuis]
MRKLNALWVQGLQNGRILAVLASIYAFEKVQQITVERFQIVKEKIIVRLLN